jgi:hypothetical protein
MPFFRNAKSVYGPDAAIIDGELTVEDCCAIEEAGLHHVMIGGTRDLSNLVRIRGLTRLDVLAVDPVDLGPVSALVELRFLSVGGNWRGHISLAALQKLEVLTGQIHRPYGKISGIQPTSKLRFASGNFNEKQLQELSRCHDLRTLVVYLTRFKNLDWLMGASHIQALSFQRCTALSDVSGLRHVPSLKFLQFGDCKKLGKLDALEALTALEVLLLDECGNIESLAPLKNLSSLRILSFIGETKVLDGRISALDFLPKGASVRFMNRLTYDRPASQFSFDQEHFADYVQYFNCE